MMTPARRGAQLAKERTKGRGATGRLATRATREKRPMTLQQAKEHALNGAHRRASAEGARLAEGAEAAAEAAVGAGAAPVAGAAPAAAGDGGGAAARRLERGLACVCHRFRVYPN